MDAAPRPDGGNLDHTFRHNEAIAAIRVPGVFLRECEEAARALTGRSVDFQLYAYRHRLAPAVRLETQGLSGARIRTLRGHRMGAAINFLALVAVE
jgi:hypothetical protein